MTKREIQAAARTAAKAAQAQAAREQSARDMAQLKADLAKRASQGPAVNLRPEYRWTIGGRAI